MPEWVPAVLDGLTGEFGVIIAESVVIYFLWRLFREVQRDNRLLITGISELTAAVNELTTELRTPVQRRRA